ncbi:proteasome activator complex subunit 4 [Microplitis demolitor]|uniref:proteasome activator complex subunit 4 n=1 Tax=Microplitis demolitor TaxID=69319 RepID=UPI0004CD24D3|nr:proteasome activator complex subunit 4 [Microplitis demolitor]
MIGVIDTLLQREEEDDIMMESSTDSLSLQYQFECKYNNLLPYAEELDEEAKVLLADIKGQLGRAVMLRRLQPDCYLAILKLRMYLKLYHFRFTKDDHILFIKLMYELIIIPSLEPSLINLLSSTLTSLMRKKELIAPTELELPWRPLYDLMFRTMKRNKRSQVILGMQRVPIYMGKTLHSLVHDAKTYFPITATQEILDELRPKLCLIDSPQMDQTFTFLECFLPVQMLPQDHGVGYKLWFEEFMKLWEIFHNGTSWEHSLMMLMSKLAWNNIGYIDWEPYIPLMFTRFMRNLNLPVTYKQTLGGRTHELGMQSVAEWIVATLGNGSSGQVYLEKLLKATETYFYQANSGPWVEKLKDLLSKLASQFVLRLHNERFGKRTWKLPTPDTHKLTNADVDAFVKCMMPVAMTAMFGHSSVIMTCKVLRLLATVRPNMVIPCVIERLYSTLDSLTEPHKLTAAMMAVTAVARPMAQGKRNVNEGYTYNEGPSRIISLLFSSLPGIDANDIKKSYVTFRLIFFYAMVMPIADCSKAAASELLDEDERLVCEETSQLEDFVLQFFDRVFSLIESSTLEYVSHESQENNGVKTRLETMVEYSLTSVCTVLLIRTSDDIFRSALHKLRAFVSERVLETRVSGPLAGSLCQSFARVNGVETLRSLLPTLSQSILDILEEGDVAKEETVEDRLLYPMLLLSNVISTQGNNLLPYMDTLINILDKTLHLKSREGSKMASKILGNLLTSLSNITLTHEFTWNGKDFNDPNYPYILYWGQGSDIGSLEMHWYVPGEEEIRAMQHIFTKYIPIEIAKIQEYCTNESSSITRQDLLTSLNIIHSILDGCGDYLPPPAEEITEEMALSTFIPVVGVKGEVKMPDGSNVRQCMLKIMTDLQAAMLKNSEDDTKSLFYLVQIWSLLLLGKCRSIEKHRRQWANWKQIKADLKDELVKRKKVLPDFIMERTELQHDLRTYSRVFYLTDYYKHIMLQLFEMATNRYTSLRIHSQELIFQALPFFPYSRKIFMPHILDLLTKDPDEFHEAHKGLLFLLLGPRPNAMIITRNWSFLRSLWPALVIAKPSEKMSIIRLKSASLDIISNGLSTVALKLEVPDECVKIATELWNYSPKPSVVRPNDIEINKGLCELKKQEADNFENYDNLICDILNAIQSNCHWRQRAMGMRLIKDIAHLDRPYPPEVINFYLNALVHDSLEERKIATSMVACILRQQKRKHVKITIDIPEEKERPEDTECTWVGKLKPGLRADNKWLQYNYESRPLTEDQWNKDRFVHERYVGFYTKASKIEVYASPLMQPNLDPQNHELTESERLINNFFAEPSNIDKLLKFNSIEERKGKDKFNLTRALLYKGIFSNYGIRHMDLFIPHLKSLVEQKQESSQRCAAEIIAGMIRGSKHWPFDMIVKFWEQLTPIIKTALDNVTTETIHDWEFCFAASLSQRDPNKHHWILECLMEEPKFENSSSFNECQRLYILQSALKQQSWRVAELMERLLVRVEKKLLANPFQNVRNTLGSLLMMIFMADYNAGTFQANRPTPRAQELMDRVLPKLLELADVFETTGSEQTTLTRANDISILKIICKWLINSSLVMSNGIIPGCAKLLPILCQLENCDTDDELRATCTRSLASIAQALTLPRDIDAILDALLDISKASSWSSRATCLSFIEVFVFHNMGVIVSNESWVERIQEIVLRLLADERLEVREKAGQVLCGLLHCAFLDEQEALLNEFKVKSKIKIKNPNDLRIRHAGVLGLCAFIRAHPYDVPKYVPSIFEYLNMRLNDPQPVPSTIRKTLGDFKRTHYDGWTSHAQSFTEEQLCILQDLNVPPSYYA